MSNEHVMDVVDILANSTCTVAEFRQYFRLLLELLNLPPEMRAFMETVAKDPTEKGLLPLFADWLEEHEYVAEAFKYKLLNSATWHLVVKVNSPKTEESEATAVGLAKTLANTFKSPPPFTVLFSYGDTALDLHKGRYVEKDYAYEVLERKIRTSTYGQVEADLLAALRRCRDEER